MEGDAFRDQDVIVTGSSAGIGRALARQGAKVAITARRVLMLYDHFPGAELVFDAYSPVHLWVSNIQTARSGFRCHWGLWRGQEIEGWSDGIHLLDEWGYFDCPEPRLAHIRWFRPFEALARTLRIYHFQLGKVIG